MAGKSGICRTVGYVDKVTGNHVMFSAPMKPTEGKRSVVKMTEISLRAVNRYLNNEWDEIDDYIFADVKLVLSELQFTADGEMVIDGRKIV